jgi:hypothetical protein
VNERPQWRQPAEAELARRRTERPFKVAHNGAYPMTIEVPTKKNKA